MPNTSETLLTVDEQAVCEKIAAQGSELVGQRAATLLAINAGLTQTQASEKSGLTVGQVQYLVTTFRKRRLAIFPEDVLSQVEPVADDDVSVDEVSPPETLDVAEDVSEVSVKLKKEKKLKKSKKAKKDKAKKADKKPKKAGKKSKKDKKSKKPKKGKGKKSGKKKSKK